MQDEIEVMHVSRTPPMGALVVRAAGKHIKQLSSISDDRLRRRILAAIGELIDFAGGYDVLVQEGVAPPLPTSTPQTAPHQDADEELTAEQAAFLDQLEREMRAGKTPKPADVIDEPLDRQLEMSEAMKPGINLVAEIDQILQRHVMSNEQLAHRSIHLRQTPGELLQIVVDGNVYEHPNDIPDETVRQVLKRALKEWESS